MPLGNVSRYSPAILKLLNKLEKSAGKVEQSPTGRSAITSPAPLTETSPTTLGPSSKPTVQIPDAATLNKLPEESQQFIIGNLIARMNEGNVGAKSPIIDPGFDIRNQVNLDRHTSGLDNIPSMSNRPIDNEQLPVLKQLQQRVAAMRGEGIPDEQIQRQLRSSNSTTDINQIREILRSRLGGTDMQARPDRDTFQVSGPQLQSSVNDTNQARQQLVGQLGNQQFLRDNKALGVPASTNTPAAITGQNVQALNEVGALDKGKFASPLLKQLVEDINTSRNPVALPGPDTPRVKTGFDEETLFDEINRTAFKKSPSKSNPMIQEDFGANLQTAPEREATFDIASDPRQVEQKQRIQDILEMRRLLQEGKLVGGPKDLNIINKLLKQETGVNSQLLKELLEEGGR